MMFKVILPIALLLVILPTSAVAGYSSHDHDYCKVFKYKCGKYAVKYLVEKYCYKEKCEKYDKSSSYSYDYSYPQKKCYKIKYDCSYYDYKYYDKYCEKKVCKHDPHYKSYDSHGHDSDSYGSSGSHGHSDSSY